MWTQVDTYFSVLSSGGRDTLGKGMVFDLFVLNRVSLSRLIWYARWILFVLQVYKSNNVSLLWRGFCPLSLTGWQNLGCCAKQGMYFRDFCPKQKNQILGGSPMLKWLSTLPPPPGLSCPYWGRSDFDSWPVSSLRQKQNYCISYYLYWTQLRKKIRSSG